MEKLYDRVERAIFEVVSISTFNHNFIKHLYSMVDKHIQSRWPLVQCRPIHGFSRVHLSSMVVRRDEEVWTRPEQGLIKVNFDGSSRGNMGISGVGCVARDEEEKILFKGVQRLQDGTNNDMEIHTALLAIELANNMNITRCI